MVRCFLISLVCLVPIIAVAAGVPILMPVGDIPLGPPTNVRYDPTSAMVYAPVLSQDKMAVSRNCRSLSIEPIGFFSWCLCRAVRRGITSSIHRSDPRRGRSCAIRRTVSDAAALLIAGLAYSYARRHVTDGRFTFGTGKLGDLTGFTSAIVLAMIALFIGYEAISRLLAPVSIDFEEATSIAVVGLPVNIAKWRGPHSRGPAADQFDQPALPADHRYGGRG